MTTAADTPIALTIAGSDPSGGAGLQADLKTFQASGVFGMSVVTVLTDCTTEGVTRVHAVPRDFVAHQLQRVPADLPPHAFKTGMLFNRDNVEVVAEFVAANPTLPYVFDPVITTRRGEPLVDADTQDMMVDTLLPYCAITTPSMPEAAVLSGREVKTRDDMRAAAATLIERGAPAVLVTGGHMDDAQSSDCFMTADGHMRWFDGVRQPHAFHGAGDCLTAAIVAALAQGQPLEAAITTGKRLLDKAAATAKPLGHGTRPVPQPGLAP